MKKLIRGLIIGFSLILFSFISNKNEESKINFIIDNECIVKMIIPSGYKKLEFSDEEGFGVIYGWKSGQIIQLIKGGLHKPPTSITDRIMSDYEDDMKSVIKGIDTCERTYWRHDKYKSIKGLTISYLNVINSDTAKFNQYLDNVKVDLIKKNLN